MANNVEVKVKVDDEGVTKTLDNLKKALNELPSKTAKLEIKHNIDDILQKLSKLNVDLTKLSGRKINIKINTNADDIFKQVSDALNKVSSKRVSMNVNTNVAKTALKLDTGKQSIDSMLSQLSVKINSFNGSGSNKIKSGVSFTGTKAFLRNADNVLAKVSQLEAKSNTSITIKINGEGFVEVNKQITELNNNLKQLSKYKQQKIKLNTSEYKPSLDRKPSRNERGFWQQGGAGADFSTYLLTSFGRSFKGGGATLESGANFLGNLTQMSGVVGTIARGIGLISAGLAGATLVGYGLYKVLSMTGNFLMTISKSGFDYISSLETANLSIAGTLVSMGKINDQQIEFNQALGVGSEIMKQLQLDAIATSATSKELVDTFRGLTGVGLSAGMTLDQIRQFTTVGVNAVKSMGLPSTQYLQELRDLVEGGIRPANSTLATALKLTDADIAEAKNSAEGLFTFLMRKMEGFKIASGYFPDTFEGIMSNIQEYATLASAEITKEFGSDIKEIGKWVVQLFGTITGDDKGKKFTVNPMITQFIGYLREGYDYLKNWTGEIAVMWDAMSDTKGTAETIEALKEFGNVILQLTVAVTNFTLVTLPALWDALSTNPATGWLVTGIKDTLHDLGRLIFLMDRYARVTALVSELSTGGISLDKYSEEISKIKEQINADHFNLIYTDEQEKNKQLADEKAKIQTTSEKLAKQFLPNSMEDANRQVLIEQGKTLDPNKITGASNKESDARIKASQKALKEGLAYIKSTMDRIKENFEDSLEKIDVMLYNNQVGVVEAEVLKAEAEKTKLTELNNAIQSQIDLVEKTTYKDPADKEIKLEPLRSELASNNRELQKVTEGIVSMKSSFDSFGRRIASMNAYAKGGATTSQIVPTSEAESAILKASQSTGVEYALLKAIATQESQLNQNAISEAGARGLMQLMPDTFAETMPNGNINDIFDNALAGAMYFKKMMEATGNDVKKALSAYNAGLAGNFDNAETRNYVVKVLEYLEIIREQISTTSVDIGSKVVDESKKYIGWDYGDNNFNPNQVVCTQLVIKSWTDSGIAEILKQQGKNFLDYVDEWTPTMVDKAIKQGVYHSASSGYTPKAGDIGISNDSGHAFLIGENGSFINSPQAGRKVYEGKDWKSSFPDIQGFISLADVIGRAGNALSTENLGLAKNKKDTELLNKQKEVIAKAQDIMDEYLQLFGNFGEVAKIKNKDKYDKIIKELRAEGLGSFADIAETLKKENEYAIQYRQNVHEAEKALYDLNQSAETMALSIKQGSADGAWAVERYSKYFSGGLLGQQIKDLETERDRLEKIGAMDKWKEADEKIKDIRKALIGYIDSFVQAVEDKIEYQQKLVDTNISLTTGQKQRASEQLTNLKYQEENAMLREKLKTLQVEYDEAKAKDITSAESKRLSNNIIDIQNLIRLNELLGKIPSLMEKVRISAKQAFEDGLNTFLTDGINEAESLSEAFNNMIISILKSIQKVFAQQITDQIMDSIFPQERQLTGAEEASKFKFDFKGFDLSGMQGNAQASAIQFNTAIDQTIQLLSNSFNQAFNKIQSFSTNLMGMGLGSATSSSSGYDFTFDGFQGALKKATGGFISGTGTGTSDSIPAMLSNGEYVIKASTVGKVGTGFLDLLNSGRLSNMKLPVNKFATGGLVGDVAMQTTARGTTTFAKELGTNVSNNVGLNVALVRDENEAMEHFLRSPKGEKVMLDFSRKSAGFKRRI